MSGRGRVLVAAGVLAVAGICLLVLAQRVPAEEAPVSSASGTGRQPTSSEEVTSPLRPSTAHAPGGGRVGRAGPPDNSRGVPPAAVGEQLPAQWPEFRPRLVVLRPEAGGPSAPVDAVGVVRGSLSLPDDADRVGWWRGGAVAGVPFGTVVVAGHLDTQDDPAGYLAGLVGMEPGDLVDLSSDTEHQRYQVRSNYLVPSADLSSASDLFAQRRRHRLVLITCGGPYDHEEGRYRDNRIVEAVPVAG